MHAIDDGSEARLKAPAICRGFLLGTAVGPGPVLPEVDALFRMAVRASCGEEIALDVDAAFYLERSDDRGSGPDSGPDGRTRRYLSA